MPNSYKFFKTEIRQWFIDNVPTGSSILDVGPGEGTYADLLEGLGYEIDAIEIHKPYIERYYLKAKYNNVYNENIMHFKYLGVYDFVILGDVLEHLDVNSAQHLLHTIKQNNLECMVAVPYMMEQDGEEYGNVHETHLQPDLSNTTMSERYPDLELIYGNSFYGYYKLKTNKHEKAYVLYCTESYADTTQGCVNSIRQWSSVPIYVYVIGSSNVDIKGANVIIWDEEEYNTTKKKFIDRKDEHIYNIMLKRPQVVLDCLEKYARTVAYVDCDSVATRYVDRMFDLYPYNAPHPYFVRGVYDWVQLDGKGAVESLNDMTGSLEHEACILFNVDQRVRSSYRQTGYFVAGQWSVNFLQEWKNMCIHPEVKSFPTKYAPYHEETLANVLLWKRKIKEELPYMYVNGSLDTIDLVKQKGYNIFVDDWLKIPKEENLLLFYHGEKDVKIMNQMIDKLKQGINVLFLAPHLSTGGMPQFLLKRIQALKDCVNITVVEYANHSDDYVVQKNQIKQLVNNFYTLGENKLEIVDIIKDNRIDIVHIEEMIEDGHNNWPEKFKRAIYAPNRTWRVVETCHNIIFKPDIEKQFHPDAYAFCTPYHLQTFKNMPSASKVIQYPIEKLEGVSKEKARELLGWDLNMKHVVNVGLWTPGKNQGEALRLAKQMPDVQFHFVGNQAGNFQHYWEPLMADVPPNVYIWGERSDVDVFMRAADLFLFNSLLECNPLVIREAIGHNLPIIARNLPQYEDVFSEYIISLDETHLKEQVYEQLSTPKQYIIPTNQLDEFKNQHTNLYQNTLKDPIQGYENVSVIHHFINQPFLELKGTSNSSFKVEFIDEKGVIHYTNTISVQHWVRLNRSWFTKWTIKVWKEDTLYYEYTLDYTDKRVYIAFDSKSLGDTIAWIPYCLEFKKKHNCLVVVSTFHNHLFEEVYPELEFVKPGTPVDNIYAQYNLGWHYDSNKEPVLPNTIPLQKAATNILGLEYKEIKPRITLKINTKPEKKYVTIATNSTAGCKFWTKEGWQEVINYLVENDFEVINVSKERNPFDNCTQLEDISIENTISHIYYSEFFIGLSSGLSWLAWALGKQVVMIANFSRKNHEFECIRVTDESLCHGCWNDPNFTFDKGDWNWCPINKNTPDQFICQRSITAEMVINEIKKCN